ncbi:hypothetical protein ACC870_38885, partial [Rhizobium ruizarguesonis]
MKFSAILCWCGSMSKGLLRSISSNPLLADSITIVGLVDLSRNDDIEDQVGLCGRHDVGQVRT